MHIDLHRFGLFVSFMAPQVTSNVSQKSGDIWRATSAREPFGTFRKIRVGSCQLIDICELLPVGRHASQNGIVEAELHDVCKLSVEIYLVIVSN